MTKMVVQLTVIYRGGDATHATVDVVGEVDMIENNTSGELIPVGDDEGEKLFKTNTSEAGDYFISINRNVCFRYHVQSCSYEAILVQAVLFICLEYFQGHTWTEGS